MALSVADCPEREVFFGFGGWDNKKARPLPLSRSLLPLALGPEQSTHNPPVVRPGQVEQIS